MWNIENASVGLLSGFMGIVDKISTYNINRTYATRVTGVTSARGLFNA
jgi:hypothetical protein